jgi:hypothetical protein
MKQTLFIKKLRSLFAFVLFILTFNVQAKKIDGYIILKTNDTIKCQIIQNFIVLKGIDISSFQAGIVVTSNNEKKEKYLPNELIGFGLYSETDTLHFLSVKVKAFTLFKGMEEKWFFMNLINDGFIKVYYYVEVMSGTSGSRRFPAYVVQLSYNDNGSWLNPLKNEEGKQDYKSFFKNFIPDYYLYFETLPQEGNRDMALAKIFDFNKNRRL